jgi:predicted extracellular nuclease
MKAMRLFNVLMVFLLAFGGAFIAAPPQAALAAPELIAPNAQLMAAQTLPYSQNFNTLITSGTVLWTNDSTLTGWYAFRTGTVNLVASNGGSNTGNLYSFGTGTATDRALGSVGSGGTGTVYWGVRLVNNTGSTIPTIRVSYTGEQWRDGGNSPAVAQTVVFSYQTGASMTSLTTGTWTDENALDFTSPTFTTTAGALDGNLAANRVALSADITINLAAGQEIMLRWMDINHPNNDHGMAIDDISIEVIDAAPTVSSTSPTNGATNVALNSALTVNFSEAVNVDSGWLSLTCGGSPVSGSDSGSGTSAVTFTPSSNLPYASSCSATVTASKVHDVDTFDPPDTMAADYTWGFDTFVDTAPYVLSTTPAHGAISVLKNANIDLTFSEPVTLGSSFFDIYCEVSLAHSAVLSGGPTSYTLDPDSDFANSESCTVTIHSEQVSDVDAYDPPDNMTADEVFSFTVIAANAPPTVTLTSPLDGATNVALDANIILTFSELVTLDSGTKAISVDSFFDIWCDVSGSHPGIVDESGNPIIAINPATDFTRGDSCTVTIHADMVTDQDPIEPATMGVDYVFGFDVIPPDPAPAVTAVTPLDSATNVATDTNLTVTFDEAVNLTDSGISIACAVSGNHTVVSSGGPTVFTLDPDPDFGYNEVCTVTIDDLAVSDQDTADPYDNMAADYSWSFTTTVCGSPHTAISAVQGSGMVSPLNGTTVTIEGIVTADWQNATEMSGYFLQSLPTDEDGDPSTSEGMFVYGYLTNVNQGDYVRLHGTVVEYNSTASQVARMYNMTEISNTVVDQICSSGNIGSITPTVIDLPVSDLDSVTYLERFEGMLVTIPEELTIQQNYFMSRFGQLSLGVGRQVQQNNVTKNPDNTSIIKSLIYLDDHSWGQNLNPIPYYNATTFFPRAGDKVTGVTGVLDQGRINSAWSSDAGFGAYFPYVYYRIHPTLAPVFTSGNPRPTDAPVVGGSVKVVGFNLENYFITIDCGAPNGTTCVYDPTSPYVLGNTPRGADSVTEYNRQLAKHLAALVKMDADVYAFTELESWDGAYGGLGSAQALADALNSAYGVPGLYAVPPEPVDVDRDVIQPGFLYKTTTIEIGPGKVDTAAIHSRPSWAQMFVEKSTGQEFWVIANHLKSKGCDGSETGGDLDLGVGQGCWNAKRVLEAEALLTFINAELLPLDPDVMIAGDLNSYGAEDPIAALISGSFVNQVAALILDEGERYSYVFDSTIGYLDHNLASPNLAGQYTGVSFWHVNADEPGIIDYNTDYKTTGSYPPDPTQMDAFRTSDHDPLLVGLNPNMPLLTSTDIQGPYIASITQEFHVRLTNPADGNPYQPVIFHFRIHDALVSDINSFEYMETPPHTPGWTPLTYVQDGADVVGTYGPITSFPIYPGFDETMLFRVNIKTAGSYNISVTIEATTPDPDQVLDVLTATTVVNPNPAPVVANPIPDQSATQDIPFSFTFAANTFSDSPAEDVMTYSATLADDSPLPAWLTFTPATRTFSGTPGDAAVGVIQIKVTATDSGPASVSDTFQLTVLNVNDWPIANDDIYSMLEDGVLIKTAVDGVLANDIDPDATDIWSAALISPPAHGTLLFKSDGAFTYTPAANWYGTDTFTYMLITVPGAKGGPYTDTAVVTINVASVNDWPIAVPDEYSVVVNGGLSVSALLGVLANDIDPDIENQPFAVLLDTVDHGILTLDQDGSFEYIPAEGFVGDDTFEYMFVSTFVKGGPYTDTALVTIHVTPAKAPPIPDQAAFGGMPFGLALEESAFADVLPAYRSSLTLTATLADGSPLPAWLHFDPASASFSGTPANQDANLLAVKVLATDPTGSYVTNRFVLVVTARIYLPTITR